METKVKVKIQGNRIVIDELLPCPFCGNNATLFLSEKGSPTEKHFTATIRCAGNDWVVGEIQKNGMTGSCNATMIEEYKLRAESIEKINEEDLKIAVELLIQRWNNRSKK